MEALTLYELNLMVQQAIETQAPEVAWVAGELAEGRTMGNGHFYGEMVEKDPGTDAVIARARLTCWANQWQGLRRYFMDETGQDLRPGMSLMLEVRPTFHPQYGFSLQIQDIRPEFTLGGQQMKRRQILNQLEQDGILHDNRELTLPPLVQRIAVVSAASAAGWGDFRNQLLHNAAGLHFHVQLFPAVMQGRHVPESVMQALSQIEEEHEAWDAVCLIRGGGAQTDLSDFDSYPLAAYVAQFPLPVITGIGHERDETVLDHVAHTHLKTPTAVAAFLVSRMEGELQKVLDLQQRIPQAARLVLAHEHRRLSLITQRLPQAVSQRTQRERSRHERCAMRLSFATRQRMERERHRQELLGQRIQALDPTLALKRGYAILRQEGGIVTQAALLDRNKALEIQMQDGTIRIDNTQEQ